MTEPTAINWTKVEGNASDESYHAFLQRVQSRFLHNVDFGNRPLFTVDAQSLWETYLESFPESAKQFHNCSACRRFIRTYGQLVTIDSDGKTQSAVWCEDDAPEPYRLGVNLLARLVGKARVTGVFLSSELHWGQSVTGPWRHLALDVSCKSRPPWHHLPAVMTAKQKMAERRQNYVTVCRALADFSQLHLDRAVALLQTDSLYRSEKVLGQAKWLQTLQQDRVRLKGRASDNVVWLAIATAPDGFCHPRSSMIGTLLEDLESGQYTDAEVASRFKVKMHPSNYQRPQAAPSLGAVQSAEKLVSMLGLAPSLQRRYARLEELQTLWTPRAACPPPAPPGVFGHLTPGPVKVGHVELPARAVTWVKFRETVLPTADRMELLPPVLGGYCAFVTAVNPDAPPLFQWDLPSERNPVSWFVPPQGGLAGDWRVSGWTEVTAVSLAPSMWRDEEAFAHFGKGALFVLKGCRPTSTHDLALFPEAMRSELHPVRSVIEAHSKSRTLEGALEATACGVIVQLRSGGLGGTLRVHSGGHSIDYKIDRWD